MLSKDRKTKVTRHDAQGFTAGWDTREATDARERDVTLARSRHIIHYPYQMMWCGAELYHL